MSDSPERKVVQILMQRVARSATAEVRWFVDEHGVHGLDVVTDEASDAVEDGGKLAIAEMVSKITRTIKENRGFRRNESYENRVGSSIKS